MLQATCQWKAHFFENKYYPSVLPHISFPLLCSKTQTVAQPNSQMLKHTRNLNIFITDILRPVNSALDHNPPGSQSCS